MGGIVAKKRIKMPVYKVTCEDFVITGEEGQEFAPRAGEWVVLRKRLPANLLRLLLDMQNLSAGEDEADGEALVDSINTILADLIPLLVQVIHSWNWTDIWDEKRAPLPPPTAETLWTLDVEEIFYLATKLLALTEAPNATSSP